MSFRSYYCCDRRYLGHDCNCPSPTQYGEALCRMLTDDGVLTAQESPPTDRDLLQRAAEALRHSIRMMSCQTQRRLARGHAPCHLCVPAREALTAIEARLKETA